MSELKRFREEKDKFFLHDHQSPLDDEQRRDFSGLRYFAENPDLRIEVDIERFPEGEQVPIQTNTGAVQNYDRFGLFRFTVDGEDVELTVFQNEHGFFLPFADSLAGQETYGAGRYLEPELLSGGRLIVDFNLAYNPYCAYNANWSCPITPAENRLSVPIRAGEKVFELH
ncbi:MAG: DUF1684 domain-containing protein [Anaerolineales bacterium]|jgi:uncharacterized protein (DUF1684 family)